MIETNRFVSAESGCQSDHEEVSSIKGFNWIKNLKNGSHHRGTSIPCSCMEVPPRDTTILDIGTKIVPLSLYSILDLQSNPNTTCPLIDKVTQGSITRTSLLVAIATSPATLSPLWHGGSTITIFYINLMGPFLFKRRLVAVRVSGYYRVLAVISSSFKHCL